MIDSFMPNIYGECTFIIITNPDIFLKDVEFSRSLFGTHVKDVEVSRSLFGTHGCLKDVEVTRTAFVKDIRYPYLEIIGCRLRIQKYLRLEFFNCKLIMGMAQSSKRNRDLFTLVCDREVNIYGMLEVFLCRFG